MKDFVPKGTGNSRFLKSVANFKSLYPTYDSFVAALVAGTLPIDLNGINADGSTQVGTALNKQNLFTDATASKFGLTDEAVPEDAFAWLGKYNMHWWKRRINVATLPYAMSEPLSVSGGSVTTIFAHVNFPKCCVIRSTSSATVAVEYSDAIRVTEQGTLELVDPITVAVGTNTEDYGSVINSMIGKFFRSSNSYSDQLIHYVPADATRQRTGNTDDGYGVYFSAVCDVYAPALPEWDTLLQSQNINEYPHGGISGDYEYQYLGVPFENAVNAPKLVRGTYVGTGTVGADAPNRLEFDNYPILVVVAASAVSRGKDYSSSSAWKTIRAAVTFPHALRPLTQGFLVYDDETTVVTWGDTYIEWYFSGEGGSTIGTRPDEMQLNKPSQVYEYVALCV